MAIYSSVLPVIDFIFLKWFNCLEQGALSSRMSGAFHVLIVYGGIVLFLTSFLKMYNSLENAYNSVHVKLTHCCTLYDVNAYFVRLYVEW